MTDLWQRTGYSMNPVLTDEFGYDIYRGETYYNINGTILSKDALDECGEFLQEEDDKFVCGLCEEEFGADEYDGFYYVIGGEKFCRKCVEDFEEEA